MEFRWDPAKAAENRRKHGVELADSVGVFEDPYALTRDAAHASEERFVSTGRDLLDRVVVVAWTPEDDAIRLISARRATPRERRQYAEDADA